MASPSIADSLSSTLADFKNSVDESFEDAESLSLDSLKETTGFNALKDDVVELKEGALEFGETLFDEIKHPLRQFVPEPNKLAPGDQTTPKTMARVGLPLLGLNVSTQTQRSETNPDEYSTKIDLSMNVQIAELDVKVGYHLGAEVKGDANMINTLREASTDGVNIDNDGLILSGGLRESLGFDAKIGEAKVSADQELSVNFDRKGYASTEVSSKVKNEISAGPGIDFDAGEVDLEQLSLTYSNETTISKTYHQNGTETEKAQFEVQLDALGETVHASVKAEVTDNETTLSADAGHISYSEDYTSIFGQLTGTTRKVSDYHTQIRF